MTTYTFRSEEEEARKSKQLERFGLVEGTDYTVDRRYTPRKDAILPELPDLPGDEPIPAPAPARPQPAPAAAPRALPEAPRRLAQGERIALTDTAPAAAESTFRQESEEAPRNPLDIVGEEEFARRVGERLRDRMRPGAAERIEQAGKPTTDPMLIAARAQPDRNVARARAARLEAGALSSDETRRLAKEVAAQMLDERLGRMGEVEPLAPGLSPKFDRAATLRKIEQSLDGPAAEESLAGLKLAGVRSLVEKAKNEDPSLLVDVAESMNKALVAGHIDFMQSAASFGVLPQADVDAARRDFEALDAATPNADHSAMGDLFLSTAEIAAPMLESLVVDGTLGMATGGLGAAARLARAGKMARTVARVGATSPYWYLRSQGAFYDRMRRAGVTDGEALAASIPAAWLISKIETTQRKQLTTAPQRTFMYRLLDRALGQGEGAKLMASKVGKALAFVGEEPTEEGVQQAVEGISAALTTAIHNQAKQDNLPVESVDAIVRDAASAFKQTLGPMLLLRAPAGVMGGVQALRDQQAERIQRGLQDVANQQEAARRSVFNPAQLGQSLFEQSVTELRQTRPDAAQALEDLMGATLASSQAMAAPELTPAPVEAAAPAAPAESKPLAQGDAVTVAPRTAKGKPVGAEQQGEIVAISKTGKRMKVKLADGKEVDVAAERVSVPRLPANPQPAEMVVQPQEQNVVRLPEPEEAPGQVQPEPPAPQVSAPAEPPAKAQPRQKESPKKETPVPDAEKTPHQIAQERFVRTGTIKEGVRLAKNPDAIVQLALLKGDKEDVIAALDRSGGQIPAGEFDVRPIKYPKKKPQKSILDAAARVVADGKIPRPALEGVMIEKGVAIATDGHAMIRVPYSGPLKDGIHKTGRKKEERGRPITGVKYPEADAVLQATMKEPKSATIPVTDALLDRLAGASGIPRASKQNTRIVQVGGSQFHSEVLRNAIDAMEMAGFPVTNIVTNENPDRATILTTDTPGAVALVMPVKKNDKLGFVDLTGPSEAAQKPATVEKGMDKMVAEAIRALSTLNSGVPLHAVGPVFRLAQAHIRQGARTFPKFISRMRASLGSAYDKVADRMRALFDRAMQAAMPGEQSLAGERGSAGMRAEGTKLVNVPEQIRRWAFTGTGRQGYLYAKAISDKIDPKLGKRVADFFAQFSPQGAAVGGTWKEDVKILFSKYALRLADLINQIPQEQRETWMTDMRTKPIPRTGALREIRRLFDEMGAEGVERGWFQKAIKNYIPRAYDPAKVAAKREAFIETVAHYKEAELEAEEREAHESMLERRAESKGTTVEAEREAFPFDPADNKDARTQEALDSAEAIADAIIGGDTSYVAPSRKDKGVLFKNRPDMLRRRSLENIPDEVLAPFMYDNHEYGLLLGIRRAIEYGEWSRRVYGGQWAKIIADLQKAGVDDGEINILEDILAGIGGSYGKMGAKGRRFRKLIGTARAMSSAALLPFVAVASAGEFAMPIVRAGRNNPFTTAKVLLEGLAGAGYAVAEKSLEKMGQSMEALGLPPSQTRALFRDLGLTQHSALQQMMIHRTDHVTGNPQVDAFMRRYFKAVGLDAMTTAQRLIATGVAKSFIKHALTHSGSAREADLLGELGLKTKGDFANLLRAANGETVHPHMQHQFNVAVLRFVGDTIVDPSRAEKSLMQVSQNPFISAMGHLQGFISATTDLVVRRNLRQAAKGNFGPLVGSLAVVALSSLARGLFDALRGKDEPKDEEWYQWAARQLYQSGMAGTYLWPYDIALALRYGGDTESYALGAFYGQVADLFSAPFRGVLKAVDKKDIGEGAKTAARALVRQAPGLRQFPGAREEVEKKLGIQARKGVAKADL